MKKVLVVHTPNPSKKEFYKLTSEGHPTYKMISNKRFGNSYYGEYNNTDRLTIIGIPNYNTKTLSIGIAFCTYPDNFSKNRGINTATLRAKAFRYSSTLAYKPYEVVEIYDFTMQNCLDYMYKLHGELVGMSILQVKKLVNTQIVK